MLECDWHCASALRIFFFLVFIYISAEAHFAKKGEKKLIQNDEIMKMAQISRTQMPNKKIVEIEFSERKRRTYCAKWSRRRGRAPANIDE